MNEPSIYAGYRERKFQSPITYAVKHRNFETRMASRSGGIFTALSDKILSESGVVYGCVLTEDFIAVHIRAERKADRDRMRGSKYIQSDMRDVFKMVKIDLEDGKLVLFSGTSCQVAGLKGFLGRDYNGLLAVDIVCHGVPSPMVWKDYLKWQEQKNGSKVVRVDFRNKKDYGWKAHVESLFLENGKQVDSRVFTTMFYGHAILRPCCYQCPYKDIVHPGNITIADYWGIDKVAPEFNDNKGVSLVLLNDKKGLDAFWTVETDLKIKETRIEDSMQPPLQAPYNPPAEREKVWKDYDKVSFNQEAKRYGGYGVVNKIKRSIKSIVYKGRNAVRNLIRIKLFLLFSEILFEGFYR